MPYVPTDWVDGVTPVDASRLDKMEAGIAAAEEKALKGAANGYAGLNANGVLLDPTLPTRLRNNTSASTVADFNLAVESGWYQANAAANGPDASAYLIQVQAWAAGGVHVRQTAYKYNDLSIWQRQMVSAGWNAWVQMWPPAPSSDITYNGAHVPATSYEDGDIVIGTDNVAYMCVTPTNTAPVAWPGGPTPAAPQTIPYGTSLPPSPADGQEAILVDSVTNPAYQWRFRFNALSSSAYKWEFVGGSPVRSSFTGSQSLVTVGSWASALPQLTLSRAGEYLFSYIAAISIGANPTLVQLGLYTTSVVPGTEFPTTQSGTWAETTSAGNLPFTATAGQTVGLGYYSSQAGTAISNRYIAAFPVRVA